MNIRGPGRPVLFIEESDAVGFEFILVVKQTVTEQPDGFVGGREAVEELRGGH